MKWAKNKQGFTIVELLIVVVVIGILAAITIVAYNGITASARDAERLAEMKSIEKALELYHIDNGGYPNCNNTLHAAGDPRNGCFMDSIESSLVPKYMSQLPKDPINSGNDRYRYAVGYRKYSETCQTGDDSDNYITGMRLETESTTVCGWVSGYYTYLGGSSN